MALTLTKDIKVSLGSVISAAVEAARTARSQQSAKEESAFQAAVAEGSMSYAAQLEFRKKQLERQRAMSVPDNDFIQTIEKSIASIKRLDRFNKYRMKYADSFADLKAGRINAIKHLEMLEREKSRTTDPDLLLEIETQLATAEADVRTYEDNILTNKVTLARNDGSEKTLLEAIQLVKDRRSRAKVNGDDEEVSLHDNTLLTLNQQLNKVKVEDTLNDLEITSIGKGLSPVDKINAINLEINKADNDAPVTINGKRYDSVQEYWTAQRDAYLAGAGSGIFQDFFSEIDRNFTEKVNAAISRDGYATTTTLDAIKSDFNLLRSKPEFQPFINRVNDMEITALGAAFKTTAQIIVDRAAYTGDFRAADDAIKSYAARYGINPESYRLVLGNELTQQVARIASATGKSPAQIQQESGLSDVLTADQFAIPKPGANEPKIDLGGTYGLHNGTIYDKVTSRPLSENELKTRLGVQTIDWNKLQFDDKYQPLPTPTTVVKPYGEINVPTSPIPDQNKRDMAQGTVKNGNLQMPPLNPGVEVPPPMGTPPKQQAPAPTPAPAPAAPKTSYNTQYKGGSIVDFLSSSGQDASFAARKKLAEQSGISGYAGSAQQNTELLKKLRGF